MSDEPANLVLEQLKLIRSEIAEMRRETRADVVKLYEAVTTNLAQTQRLARRLTELSLDLEAMLKAEVMGQNAVLRRDIEARIAELESRLTEH